MKLLWLFTLIISIMLCSCLALLESENTCEFTESRSVTVDATGAKKIRINAMAGFLKVSGNPKISEVRVNGTACAPKADLLEEIILEAYSDEDTVIIIAESNVNNVQLDLTIDLPDSIALEIVDYSGEINVLQVKSLSIKDGSGAILVENVTGDVYINDGSGAITLNQIAGNVRLQDGSGAINVKHVTGEVIVDDGSGGIDISWVGGSVIIHSDGSGNIFVSNVQGDFIVESDGSGSIDYSNIGGRIQLP